MVEKFWNPPPSLADRRVRSSLQCIVYAICNIASSLTLEKPKINPYIPEMKKGLAQTMGIMEDQVSIKATTNEKMGYVGREEGVNAYAVALISKP